MNTSNLSLAIAVLPYRYAVRRLPIEADIPSWSRLGSFFSITRTTDELSIVCSEESVPDDVSSERGWRVLKLEGPFDFSVIGILVSIAAPLSQAGINIFTISTYDTDYVLIKDAQLHPALTVLREYGHTVHN